MRVKSFRMFVVVWFLAMATLLIGCSFYRLPANSTADQKAAALCADAKLGLGVAQVGLDIATTQAQKAYWAKYLKGVQAAVELACAGMGQ